MPVRHTARTRRFLRRVRFFVRCGETARRLVRLFFAFRIILLVNRALICYNRLKAFRSENPAERSEREGNDNGTFGSKAPDGLERVELFQGRGKINETVVRETADAMVEQGFRDAGYVYVSVDDCWMSVERDANGDLQADPVKFPSGMKALGDYIHERG